MKTKKKIEFKVVLGSRTNRRLKISQIFVQSIIQTWREDGKTADLPRHGHQLKLTGWERRALLIEATKRSSRDAGQG